MKPRLRAAALPVAFVAGAVLGTAWDQFHVRSSTLVYSEPTVAGQPWWVPLEFGLAFAVAVVAFATLGDPAPRRTSLRAAGIEAVWLTAVYATTAFFSRYPWLLAAVLVALLAARAGDFRAAVSAHPIPSLAVCVAGPLWEALLITAGHFEYRNQQFGPIPIWLPLLWVNGVPFIARLTDALLQLFGQRRPQPDQEEQK